MPQVIPVRSGQRSRAHLGVGVSVQKDKFRPTDSAAAYTAGFDKNILLIAR